LAPYLFASTLCHFAFSFSLFKAGHDVSKYLFLIVFVFFVSRLRSVADKGKKRVGEGDEANGHVVLDHVDPVYSGGRQLLHYKAVRVLGGARDGRVDDLHGRREARALASLDMRWRRKRRGA